MNPYDNIDISKYLDMIPEEEIDRLHMLDEKENENIYTDFILNLKIGRCSICGEKMDSFDDLKPCFHWFTYPNGIKKKHFNKYLETPIGFYNVNSYFRWLANTENPILSINDLKAETSTTSYLETTFKYKKIEWAFSIGFTDKDGHRNSRIGSRPHFHIQMSVENRIFLKFNDFHIPFSDEDLFNIAASEQVKDRFKLEYPYGWGMGFIEDKDNQEALQKLLSENEATVILSLDTGIKMTKRSGKK